MTGYPIKLVRDHVGNRLGGDGTITYEPVRDREEHIRLLRLKLAEEVAEYLLDPSIGELADVLTVVIDLAHKAHPTDDIYIAHHLKADERGTFNNGTVMTAHHDTDEPRP